MNSTFRFQAWCARVAPRFARFSIALAFFWFGALKLAGASPAIPLISATFFFLPASPVVLFLGTLEVVIAVTFLIPRFHRFGVGLLLCHLVGTFLSFITAPARCFVHAPFLLTTEGEFVIKNLILIGTALLLLAAELPKQQVRTLRTH